MFETLRDGMRVWPYCTSCGCRLKILEVEQMGKKFHFVEHFGNWGRPIDARGCKCKYAPNLQAIPSEFVQAFI